MQYKVIAVLIGLLAIGGVVAGLLIKIKTLNNELLESKLYLSECKSAIELQNKEIEQFKIDVETKHQKYLNDLDNISSKYEIEKKNRLNNINKKDIENELLEIERLYKDFFQ